MTTQIRNTTTRSNQNVSAYVVGMASWCVRRTARAASHNSRRVRLNNDCAPRARSRRHRRARRPRRSRAPTIKISFARARRAFAADARRARFRPSARSEPNFEVETSTSCPSVCRVKSRRRAMSARWRVTWTRERHKKKPRKRDGRLDVDAASRSATLYDEKENDDGTISFEVVAREKLPPKTWETLESGAEIALGLSLIHI